MNVANVTKTKPISLVPIKLLRCVSLLQKLPAMFKVSKIYLQMPPKVSNEHFAFYTKKLKCKIVA